MPSGGAGEEEPLGPPEQKHPRGTSLSSGNRASRPAFTKREVDAGEFARCFNEEESHDDQET
jgi:hypothetical protein